MVLIVCLIIISLDVPGMGRSGMSVNMMVSSEGIKLTSIENGRVIANHDMQGISFASGGEKVLGTLYNVLFQAPVKSYSLIWVVWAGHINIQTVGP